MRRSLRSCCLGLGLWSLAILGTWAMTATTVTAQDSDVQSLLDEGFKSYKEGNKVGAIASLEKALALKPANDVVFDVVRNVTVALVVEMTMDDDPKVSGLGLEILNMAGTHYKKAIDDAETINAVVRKVLGSEGGERITSMIESANDYGRNLVPALIPILGDADIGNRTTAVIWIAQYIGRDAVPPLVAAWKHESLGVRVNIAKLLGARLLRHKYSLAYLKAMIETDASKQVKDEAQASFDSIVQNLGLGSSADEPAKKLFLRNAHALFLSPHLNPFDKSLYSAKTFALDGEAVVGERVARFQLAERMAAANLEEALALDASYAAALLLTLLNDCAQVVEYDENLAWYASRDVQGDVKAVLEMQKPAVDSVLRLRTLAMPANVLFTALRQASKYKRTEIAHYIVHRIRDRKFSGAVPDALIEALEDDNSRLVRIAAAIALAEWNPQSDFDAGAQVVSILESAIVQSGIRTVVKAMGSQALANRFDGVLDDLNMESNRHLTTVAQAFQAVTQLPPDLVLVDEKLRLSEDTNAVKSINQFVVELRGNYRTAEVPVIVVVDPARLDKGKELYADEEKKVWVVPGNVDAVTLRKTILGPLFAEKADSKALASTLAAQAATALERLATYPNPLFPVKQSLDALGQILSNRPDSVRIPCLRALGSLGATAESLASEIAQVYANSDNSVAVREEAMLALGRILSAGSASAAGEVAEIISGASAESDLKLRRAVWMTFADAGFDDATRFDLLTSEAVGAGKAAGDDDDDLDLGDDDDDLDLGDDDDDLDLGDDDDDDLDLGDDDDDLDLGDDDDLDLDLGDDDDDLDLDLGDDDDDTGV